jgi:uncharacterized protein (TIGR02285 family)
MWRLLCCLAYFSAQSYAQPAPILFVDAIGLLQSDAGQSVEGQTFKAILSKLEGQYELTQIQRNRARSMLLNEPRACSPWLKKTAERSQKYSFSIPYMYEPGLQLVVQQNSRWIPELQSLASTDGTIHLQSLLQQENTPLIGIESNRSYGEELDQILNKFQSKLYIRTSSSSQPGSMLPMLERHFIDATIEYPAISATTKVATMQFKLHEAAAFSSVHIACTKSAQGGQNLQIINQVIRELAQENNYRRWVLEHVGKQQADAVIEVWDAALVASTPQT